PDKTPTFAYFLGLMFSSYTGWVGGTVIGSILGNIIPESVTSAMGIALYAMYVAIILPPATKSRPIVCVIAFAVAISSVIKFVPLFSSLGSGWSVIISGVCASALGAVIFPLEVSENEAADA
ncbi:MAG: branched-chain amino acid ABC transporter permease, partial [Clostridia bacterium]|nr:branched-chain amino acid ABC transporter permease [Clostridia bacterium]